jgi:hypothetical protein
MRERVFIPPALLSSAYGFPNASFQVADSTFFFTNPPFAMWKRISYSFWPAHRGMSRFSSQHLNSSHNNICLSPALDLSSKLPSTFLSRSQGSAQYCLPDGVVYFTFKRVRCGAFPVAGMRLTCRAGPNLPTDYRSKAALSTSASASHFIALILVEISGGSYVNVAD